MAEDAKGFNWQGLAAVITAIAGLITAISLINPKPEKTDINEPSQVTEDTLDSASETTADKLDFCSSLSSILDNRGVNSFKNIQGDITPEHTEENPVYYSNILLTGARETTISTNQNNDQVCSSTFIQTKDSQESSNKYDSVYSDLQSCLLDWKESTGLTTDEDGWEIHYTNFTKSGAEVRLELYSKENEDSYVLVSIY